MCNKYLILAAFCAIFAACNNDKKGLVSDGIIKIDSFSIRPTGTRQIGLDSSGFDIVIIDRKPKKKKRNPIVATDTMDLSGWHYLSIDTSVFFFIDSINVKTLSLIEVADSTGGYNFISLDLKDSSLHIRGDTLKLLRQGLILLNDYQKRQNYLR